MKRRSGCYKNSADGCAMYGRFYTWSVAMDSAGTFSTNGKRCGSERTCSPTYPVRGICPEGWHLPTKEEWTILISAMGGSSNVMQAKGFKDWPDATNAFGFSALPTGQLTAESNSIYYYAAFWSATQSDADCAYYLALYRSTVGLYYLDGIKYSGYSVRCLKD